MMRHWCRLDPWRVGFGLLVCAALFLVAPQLSAGPQWAVPLPAPTPPPRPFQTAHSKTHERKDGALVLQGDVRLDIDEETAVLADEAELRHDTHGGCQILLPGDIRLLLKKRPSIEAQYARRVADDGIAYRSDVRIAIGSFGAKVLADECDYWPTKGEFKLTLRGNVRIERDPGASGQAHSRGTGRVRAAWCFSV